jgi:hypothetical protein
MASLDFVIRLLEAAENAPKNTDEISARCDCAVSLLERFITRYANEVSNSVAVELQTSLEATNFPDIATHLYTVLLYKLTHSETAFVEISGFRLDTNTCMIYATIPELSTLGSHEDWKSMQEAGWDLFDTSGKAKTARQRAAGWYFHYTNFITGAKGSDVYPAIMRARLNWGVGRRLAPYWYWYDTSIDTRYGTPSQQPLDLRGIIRTCTEKYVQAINTACATATESGFLEIGIKELGEQIEKQFDGEDTTKPPPTVNVRYGGTYKGRVLTEDEVLRLITSGDITVSRQYILPNGDIRINYQETSRGKHFTGLYQRITRA